MSAHERKITAYHEGGHAIVAAAMNHTDPVTKVTIPPRRALATRWSCRSTTSTPRPATRSSTSLAYAMGGRVAEEIVFHDPTTGASNDIEKATAMARKMVTEYGMSERVGAVKLGRVRARSSGPRHGPPARLLEEVAAWSTRRCGSSSRRDEAWHVINDNRDILDNLVLELLEEETLDHQAELADDLQDIRSKRPRVAVALQRPPALSDDQPPVLTPAERQPPRAARGGRHDRPRGQTRPPSRPGRSTRPPPRANPLDQADDPGDSA